jgi:hypothetical protein
MFAARSSSSLSAFWNSEVAPPIVAPTRSRPCGMEIGAAMLSETF